MLILQCVRDSNGRETILQVPSQSSVLDIIHYHHDVSHAGMRTTTHVIRSKYTWMGLYKGVKIFETIVSKNLKLLYFN